MKRGRDKEKKEEEKNPLHVEYGVLRNVRYILKNMVRADSHILPIIVMGVVCAPFMQYLWGFLSKLIVDRITGVNAGETCGCDLCILRGPACDGADADLLQRQLVALYRCAHEDDTGEESQDHAHRL